MNKKLIVDSALNITEEARYTMGIMEFITSFFDYWTFKQTGLYQSSQLPAPEIEVLFIRLSNCLAAGARLNPEADIFGSFLSQCQFKNRGMSFYPTPELAANTLSELVADARSECHLQKNISYYEPCVGTGINAISWLSKMKEKGYPVRELILYLEDIDRVMVKACFMQLLFYFDSINEWPKFLSIQCVDSITRRSNGLIYMGSGVNT